MKIEVGLVAECYALKYSFNKRFDLFDYYA